MSGKMKMTETYLIQWFHLYIIHFSAWITFAIGAHVVKNGVPILQKSMNILLSSIFLASIVALFSSHAHNHYLQFLK